MNLGEQILIQDFAFLSFGYVLRSRIAESYGHSVFNFLRNHLFSTVVTSFYISTSSVQEVYFLYIFTGTCYFLFLIIAILIECDVIPHWGIDLHFPNDSEVENLVLLGYLCIFTGKMSIQVLRPFLTGSFVFGGVRL